MRIVRFLGFTGIEHLYCTCTAHNGDFGGRPCVVHVAAELLTAHHDVASSVALAQCHGYLGHCGFAVSVEKLGAMQDYAVVFLACTGRN